MPDDFPSIIFQLLPSWSQNIMGKIVKVTWHTATHVPINIFANFRCQRLINKSVLISRMPPNCRSLQSYDDIKASLIDCDQICWIVFLGKRWWLVKRNLPKQPFFMKYWTLFTPLSRYISKNSYTTRSQTPEIQNGNPRQNNMQIIYFAACVASHHFQVSIK